MTTHTLQMLTTQPKKKRAANKMYLVVLWAFAVCFFICLCCEHLHHLLSNWWKCFLDLLVLFLFACVFWSCSALSSLGHRTYTLQHVCKERNAQASIVVMLWMCSEDWHGREEFAKVIVFVFFVHKKYSHIIIKLRLNLWCLIDVLFFSNIVCAVKYSLPVGVKRPKGAMGYYCSYSVLNIK